MCLLNPLCAWQPRCQLPRLNEVCLRSRDTLYYHKTELLSALYNAIIISYSAILAWSVLTAMLFLRVCTAWTHFWWEIWLSRGKLWLLNSSQTWKHLRSVYIQYVKLIIWSWFNFFSLQSVCMILCNFHSTDELNEKMLKGKC